MLRRCVLFVLLAATGSALHSAPAAPGMTPGSRVLLDAHNCYPYDGRWPDRIDRALGTGTPLAVEQDLFWFVDPQTGAGRSLVTHGAPYTGTEPTMKAYFFERIRPLVEQALRDNRRDQWPIVTLNLDFKSDEAAHHDAVWALLGEYESWLSTAPRTALAADLPEITPGPLLVLTGEQDEQERDFYERVPVGGKLRLFGAVHRSPQGGLGAKTNYRRWSNNPWSVVEPEGQPKAGAWTPEDAARLAAAVRAAHDGGLWIRFYTLDGLDPADTSGGWSPTYNFGSLEAVRERWLAVIKAGVDFVAVDQYEEFSRTLHAAPAP